MGKWKPTKQKWIRSNIEEQIASLEKQIVSLVRESANIAAYTVVESHEDRRLDALFYASLPVDFKDIVIRGDEEEIGSVLQATIDRIEHTILSMWKESLDVAAEDALKAFRDAVAEAQERSPEIDYTMLQFPDPPDPTSEYRYCSLQAMMERFKGRLHVRMETGNFALNTIGGE